MLMALVARKHFIGRQSKSQIAAELYLSRFKVARLLESADKLGIVRFSIALPGDVNLNLSHELKDRFGLKHAVVIDDVDDDEAGLIGRLGSATVGLLSEVIKEGDLVGIASTRALLGLGPLTMPFPNCRFVQLTGVLSRPDAADILDGIRKLTRQANGTADVFYAPLVTSDVDTWKSHHDQPDLRRAFAKFPRLTVTVTGIGAWKPGLSVIYDYLPEKDREDARRAGAVAEIVGVPIDVMGNTVPGTARQKIIAPDAEVLRNVQTSIGISFDPGKADAVRLVIASKLINSFVTHRALAEKMLAS